MLDLNISVGSVASVRKKGVPRRNNWPTKRWPVGTALAGQNPLG